MRAVFVNEALRRWQMFVCQNGALSFQVNSLLSCHIFRWFTHIDGIQAIWNIHSPILRSKVWQWTTHVDPEISHDLHEPPLFNELCRSKDMFTFSVFILVHQFHVCMYYAVENVWKCLVSCVEWKRRLRFANFIFSSLPLIYHHKMHIVFKLMFYSHWWYRTQCASVAQKCSNNRRYENENKIYSATLQWSETSALGGFLLLKKKKKKECVANEVWICWPRLMLNAIVIALILYFI